MIHFRLVLFTVLSAWYVGCSPSDPIVVEQAWARPTPMSHSSSNQPHDHDGQKDSGNRAAVYLTIRNNDSQSHRLQHLSSSVADTIEIHQSAMGEDGIMRMQAVEFVDLPAGNSITFKPGGYHLMLIGVDPLHEGNEFQITLTFDSPLEASATVVVGHLDR